MAHQPYGDRVKPICENERNPRLLIVDEKPEDLREYSATLRCLNYDVRSAGSYSEAAALLEKEAFDLVMVDQGSENFEGRSVLRRAVEIDRQVPVLVLTGAVDVDCCLSALDMGAREYVQKTLTRSEMQEMVAEYLGPPVPAASAGSEPLFHPKVANLERWRRAS